MTDNQSNSIYSEDRGSARQDNLVRDECAQSVNVCEESSSVGTLFPVPRPDQLRETSTCFVLHPMHKTGCQGMIAFGDFESEPLETDEVRPMKSEEFEALEGDSYDPFSVYNSYAHEDTYLTHDLVAGFDIEKNSKFRKKMFYGADPSVMAHLKMRGWKEIYPHSGFLCSPKQRHAMAAYIRLRRVYRDAYETKTAFVKAHQRNRRKGPYTAKDRTPLDMSEEVEIDKVIAEVRVLMADVKVPDPYIEPTKSEEQLIRIHQLKQRLEFAKSRIRGHSAAVEFLTQWLSNELRPQVRFAKAEGFADLLVSPDMNAAARWLNRLAPVVEDGVTSLPEASEAIKDGMADIKKASTQMTKTGESAQRMFDKYSDLAERLMTTYEKVVPAMSLTKVLQGTCLLFRIVDAFSEPSKMRVAVTLIEFLVFLEIDTSSLSKTMKWLQSSTKLITEEDVLEAQGFQEPISILFALVGVLACGAIPKPGVLKRAKEYASSLNAFVPAAQHVKDLFSSIGDKLPSMIQAWFFAACPVSALREALMGGKYKKWVLSTEKCFLPDFKESLISSQESGRIVDELYEEGLTYYSCLGDTELKPGNIFAGVAKHFDMVRSLKKVRDALKTQNMYRPRPFFIYLSGGTSVGKSVLAQRVASALAPPDLEPSKLLYSRNIASDFWDGYWRDTFGVVLDDVGADSEGKEFLEIISMMTNAPYIVNMAGLEDGPSGAAKGCQFSSRVVIGCSNHSYPRTTAITHIEAEWRRRDVLWEISVKPEFQNMYKHLDVNRVADERILTHSDHVIWQRCDPNEPGPNGHIGQPVGTREAVIIMRRLYEAHVKNQMMLLDSFINSDFKDWINEADPEREKYEEFVDAQAQAMNGEEAEKLISSAYLAEQKIAKVPDARYVVERKGKRPMTKEQELKNLATDKEVAEMVNDTEKEVGKWEVKNTMFALLKKYATLIAFGIGMLAAGAAAYTYSKVARKNDEGVSIVASTAESGAMASGSSIQRSHPPQKMVVPRSVAAQVQATSDIQANVLLEKLKKQQVLQVITTENEGDHPRAGLGLFLGGRLALFNLHIFLDDEGEVIQDGKELRWYCSNKTPFYEFVHKFERRRLHIFKKKFQGELVCKDFCIYNYPTTLQCFPDIRSQFAKESDYSNDMCHPGALLQWDIKSHTIHVTPKISAMKMCLRYFSDTERNDGKGYMFVGEDGVEYPLATAKGYCGSPLVSTLPSAPRKIIGIHRAGAREGRNPLGFAEIVLQEDIDLVWEKTNQRDGAPKITEVVAPVVEVQNKLLEMEEVIGIGKLSRNRVTPLPTKTSIEPSVIYEKIYKHVTEPSVLSQGDERLEDKTKSPLWESLSKQGIPFYTEDPDELKVIFDDIRDELQYNSRDGCLSRILTEHEAINGKQGYEFIDALTMDTSPGFPYKKDDPGRNKRHLFEGEPGDLKVKSVLLRAKLDEQWSSWMKGIRTEDYVMDCLKDERRPIRKVKQGATRAFNVCSTHFVINFRRLFLPWFAYLMRNRAETTLAVGMNPMAEWDQMTRRFMRKCEVFFAGDYKKFDGKMMPQVILEICCMANEWFDDEFVKARLTVFEQLCFAVHMCLSIVYVLTHCNPSGQPGTTIFNSIFNMYLLRKAWRILAPESFRDLYWFRQLVLAKVFGDDNTVGTTAKVGEWFNLRTFAAAMETIGIEYTPPDKGEITESLGPLERWSFLKYGWRRDDAIQIGVWLPVMDMTVIQELTNWIRRGENAYDATVSNCNDSLRFVFFHGREAFRRHRELIMRAFREADEEPPVLITWSMLLTEFRGGDMRVWNPSVMERVQSLYEAEAQSGKITVPITNMTQDQTSSTAEADSAGTSQTTAAQTFTQSNELGVITSDQTTKEVALQTKGQTTTARSVNALMPDKTWSIDDTTRRMAFLKELPWTTSDAVGAVLNGGTMLNVPYDLIADPTQALGWNTFQYARPSMRVTIRLQAHRFAQGAIKVCYVPGFANGGAAKAKLGNMSNVTSLPGAFMEACTSGTCVVVIPYQNVQAWIKTQQTTKADVIGQLGIVVFSQLVVPAGSPTTVNLTIVTEIVDAKFRVLNPDNLPTYRYAQAQGFLDFVNGIGKVIHKATNVIKDVEEVVTSPLTKMTGALDYPTVSLQIDQVTAKMPNLTYTEGVDHSTKMTLSPASQVLLNEETFGTDTRETVFSNLVAKWGYLGRFTWSTSDSSGDIKFSDCVTPLSGAMGNILDALPGNHATKWVQGALTNVSPLEYVTIPHRFWSGSLRYRVICFASAFHTGQLIVQYWPGRSTAPSATGNQRTARWYQIFELNQASHEFEFTAPFVSGLGAKLVPNGSESLGVNDDIILNPETYQCGLLAFSVLTTLQAPASIANEIDVVVLKAGGEDFRVNFLSPVNRSITAGLAFADAEPQSGTVDTANLKGVEAQVGSPAIAPVDQQYEGVLHFGDNYDDCITELKRFCLAAQYSWTVASTSSFVWLANIKSMFMTAVGTIGPGGSSTTPEQVYNLFHWWSSIFRYWHGTLRFKVFITNAINPADTSATIGQQFQVAVTYIPDYSAQTTTNFPEKGGNWGLKQQRGYPIEVATVNGTMNYLEFQIPFATVFNCLKTAMSEEIPSEYVQPYLDLGNLQFDIRSSTASETSRFRLDVYMAVGDEFMFGGYCGVPSAMALVTSSPDWYTVPARGGNGKKKKVVAQSEISHPMSRSMVMAVKKLREMQEMGYDVVEAEAQCFPVDSAAVEEVKRRKGIPKDWKEQYGDPFVNQFNDWWEAHATTWQPQPIQVQLVPGKKLWWDNDLLQFWVPLVVSFFITVVLTEWYVGYMTSSPEVQTFLRVLRGENVSIV